MEKINRMTAIKRFFGSEGYKAVDNSELLEFKKSCTAQQFTDYCAAAAAALGYELEKATA